VTRPHLYPDQRFPRPAPLTQPLPGSEANQGAIGHSRTGGPAIASNQPPTLPTHRRFLAARPFRLQPQLTHWWPRQARDAANPAKKFIGTGMGEYDSRRYGACILSILGPAESSLSL
jgi:hypothetical protein